MSLDNLLAFSLDSLAAFCLSKVRASLGRVKKGELSSSQVFDVSTLLIRSLAGHCSGAGFGDDVVKLHETAMDVVALPTTVIGLDDEVV